MTAETVQPESKTPAGIEPGRAVLLLAGPGDASAIVANALSRKSTPLVVVMEHAQSRVTLARRRARRLGWWVVLGQVLFVTLIMPVLRYGGRRRIQSILSQNELDPSFHTPVREVSSVNADETVSLIKQLDPAVIVVNGTRIISPRVLSSINCPIINIHAGITPQYRGVHGGYWAIAGGRPDLVGTTVHLVDPGIDTGSVLARAYFDPLSRDSIATYPYLHLAAGLPGLLEQLDGPLEGRSLDPLADPPSEVSRLYTHPTVWGYLWRRVANGVR